MSDIVRERHEQQLIDGVLYGHCRVCDNEWPCDTSIERARADKAERDLADLLGMERRPATDEVHADNSYGDCVSCRIIDLNGPWDANHDDSVTTTVPFPCAVIRADKAEAASFDDAAAIQELGRDLLAAETNAKTLAKALWEVENNHCGCLGTRAAVLDAHDAHTMTDTVHEKEKAAHQEQIKLKVIPDTTWLEAYGEAEILRWLLGGKRVQRVSGIWYITYPDGSLSTLIGALATLLANAALGRMFRQPPYEITAVAAVLDQDAKDWLITIEMKMPSGDSWFLGHKTGHGPTLETAIQDAFNE